MTDAIDNRLHGLLADYVNGDLARVKPDALLKDDLGMDSLHRIEFVMDIEEEFGISIPDIDEDDYPTVADWVALVNARLAER